LYLKYRVRFQTLVSSASLRHYTTGKKCIDLLALDFGGAVQVDPRLTLLAFNA